VARKRKINVADPLDFDHEADAQNYVDAHDLPGGDVLLTPADLAKRWRTSVDALRKQRERGTSPPFVCSDRRHIRYRLLDVVNFEANRVAYPSHMAPGVAYEAAKFRASERVRRIPHHPTSKQLPPPTRGSTRAFNPVKP
jgi:hypothetical protein